MRRAAQALIAPLSVGLLVAAGASAWAIGGLQPGAATPQTIKLPSGPNSVRGLSDEAQVDAFSAQINYRVPIEMPGAVRGFRPSLDLVYSGDLGNGPLGVGWMIGSPQIRRSLRLGVPSYNDADEIELTGVGPGGRLVSIASGQWRIEGQGQFYKVESQANGGFKLTDGNGVQYFFGSSSASQHASGTHVQAWLLDAVVDQGGQTISLTYTRDQNELYLTSISWGPSQAYLAMLGYAPRADAVLSYRRGYRVVTGQRLTAISLVAFGQPLASYQLAYDDSLPLSRLAAVTRLGRDGTTALPTLRFGYGTPVTPNLATVAGSGGWLLGQGVSFLDVDGDGAQDLVRIDGSINQWRRNLGGSFDVAQTLTGITTIDLNSARLMDLYGTARPELVVNNVNSWTVYTLSGNSWTSQGTYPGTVNLPLISSANAPLDLNGDSRTDMLGSMAGGIVVNLNSANGFVASNVPAIGGDSTVTPSSVGLRFFDINGDGLDDAVQLQDTRLRAFIGHGDGTFDAPLLVSYPFTDPLTDYSTLQLADLNRDGLMDLVRVAAGNVEWYPGLPGYGFGAVQSVARPEPTDANVVLAIADINGNGSQDLVWSSPNGMWALDLAGATSVGMLVSIDNGMGKTTRFSYDATVPLAAAARAAGQPWARTLPISIPVPVRTEVDLADGEPARVVDFIVRDGYWDFSERRFGGFQTTTRHFPDAGGGERWEVTGYNLGLTTNRELRGKPVSVSVYVGAEAPANLVTSESDTWQALVVDGLPSTPLALLPALKSKKVAHFEHVTTPLVAETDYVYDSAGHLTEEHRLGRTDLHGDEVTILRSWASNDALWVRDRVFEEKRVDGSNTLVSDVQWLFGDDQTQLPLGQVGKGWLRQAQQYYQYGSDATRWVIRESNTYDAVGNLTSSFRDGVARSFAYDGFDLHPVQETVSPSPSVTLTWGAQWDEVIGQPTQLTEPSGVVTSVGYDALGRVVSSALGNATPHQVYSYDWSAPQPRTYRWVYDGAAAQLTPFSGQWSAGDQWRQSVSVENGAGEAVLSATRLSASQWAVDELRQRDARGRLVAVTRPFYSASGDISIITPGTAPAGTPAITLAWDGVDRLVTQTLPTGVSESRSYSAFASVDTLSGLAPVSTRADGLDRIIHTERTVNGITEAVDGTYDAADRIVQLSLQGGQVAHNFVYDTLGRLRSANDPDIGPRSLRFDDADRLTGYTNGANQTVNVSYDGAGRVATVTTSDGSAYVYHYDLPRASGDTNTQGRVAWIEEPSGTVELSYDAFGRASDFKRVVDGDSAERTVEYSPSGLPLAFAFDDGLQVAAGYDRAGRQQALGSYWQATALDAGGRVLNERYGNGVQMVYGRDAMGQRQRIQVLPAAGAALYDVSLTRSPFGAIAGVTDQDGVGLDHSASFGFDAGARLTQATLGRGAAAYSFSYAYDGLQNMISRGASGPSDIGVFSGSYVYGENGAGPRQLTSIHGTSAHSFRYDAAGRQIAEDGRTLQFNALDQLNRVTAADGSTLTQQQYGYDGLRVYSRGADGREQRWITVDTVDRDGLREHYLSNGDRVVARLSLPAPAQATSTTSAVRPRASAALSLAWLPALFLLLPRGSRRRLRAGALLALWAFGNASCGGLHGGSLRAPLSAAPDAIYFHQGISQGPMMLTRADGSIVEERRFEPFGQPIDDSQGVAGAGRVGTVDFRLDPLNSLGKETDLNTGWSYHGARWLAPESGRWLAPDAPTKGPDPGFLSAPWKLHPYQYVTQNPLLFWDPDGRAGQPVEGSGYVTLGKTAYATETSSGVKVEVGKAQITAGSNGSSLSVGAKVTTLSVEKSVPLGSLPVTVGVGATAGEVGVKASADPTSVSAGAKANVIAGNASVDVKDVAKVKVELGVQLGLGFKVGSELKGDVGPVSVTVDVTPAAKQLGQAALYGADAFNRAEGNTQQLIERAVQVGGDGDSNSRLQHLDGPQELPEGGVPEPADNGG